MPNNPAYNLTDQKISFTFQNILQTDGFGNYYNGLGDEIFISGGSGGGAPGATGATGPAGATGATGPAGAGEFYYQSNSFLSQKRVVSSTILQITYSNTIQNNIYLLQKKNLRTLNQFFFR